MSPDYCFVTGNQMSCQTNQEIIYKTISFPTKCLHGCKHDFEIMLTNYKSG